MLAAVAKRSFTKIQKASVRLVGGVEWITFDGKGQSAMMTCGDGAAPTPPDHLELAYGVQAGGYLKELIEKAGKTVNSLEVELAAEWQLGKIRKFKEVRMNFVIDSPDLTQEETNGFLDKVKEQFQFTPSLTLID